jgi:hypothetical protein
MVLDTLKQVGNQFGGFLNRSTIGNVQRAGLSLSRQFNGAVGNINSTFNFSNLRASVQSFGAREIMDDQILQEQLRMMATYAQRVTSFNANTYSGIYQTYSSNPRKLKDVVQDIVGIYIHDTNAFHEAYLKFMGALKDALSRLDNLDEGLMSSVLSFLKQAEKLAAKGNFNLPENAVDIIKRKIYEFTEKQKNKLNRYALDDTREIINVQNNTAGRTIKTMMGISWVAFKGKRLIDKISNVELKKILINIAEIQRQIDANKLEANFFPMLLEYFGSVDSCEVMVKDYREDMKLLFSTVEKDYSLVRGSMAEFVTILGNEEGASALKNQINVIEKVTGEIKSELSAEAYDIEKLMEDLATLQRDAPQILDHITKLSQAMLERIKNPDLADKVLKDYAKRR